MVLTPHAKELLESAQAPFNIIEEYAALSPKRKVLLCEQLFMDGKARFNNMVMLLWPEATKHDMKRLEKFLIALRSTIS